MTHLSDEESYRCEVVNEELRVSLESVRATKHKCETSQQVR